MIPSNGGNMEAMKDWIKRTGGLGRDSVPIGKVLNYYEGATCLFCEIPEQIKSSRYSFKNLEIRA